MPKKAIGTLTLSDEHFEYLSTVGYLQRLANGESFPGDGHYSHMLLVNRVRVFNKLEIKKK